MRGKCVLTEHRQSDIMQRSVAVVESQGQTSHRARIEQRRKVDDRNIAVRECLEQDTKTLRSVGQWTGAIVNTMKSQHGAHDGEYEIDCVEARSEFTRCR